MEENDFSPDKSVLSEREKRFISTAAVCLQGGENQSHLTFFSFMAGL